MAARPSPRAAAASVRPPSILAPPPPSCRPPAPPAALTCLMQYYGVADRIPQVERPALVLSAEQELGITAGLQDRVIQVSHPRRPGESPAAAAIAPTKPARTHKDLARPGVCQVDHPWRLHPHHLRPRPRLGAGVWWRGVHGFRRPAHGGQRPWKVRRRLGRPVAPPAGQEAAVLCILFARRWIPQRAPNDVSHLS